MKLKLMIALVILALVFGITFIACDDGDLPVIEETKKADGTVTGHIEDILLLGTGVVPDTAEKHKNELTGGKADTTGNTVPNLVTAPAVPW